MDDGSDLYSKAKKVADQAVPYPKRTPPIAAGIAAAVTAGSIYIFELFAGLPLEQFWIPHASATLLVAGITFVIYETNIRQHNRAFFTELQRLKDQKEFEKSWATREVNRMVSEEKKHKSPFG